MRLLLVEKINGRKCYINEDKICAIIEADVGCIARLENEDIHIKTSFEEIEEQIHLNKIFNEVLHKI